MNLLPLVVPEAVDGVINLKDVPDGATARIPEPLNHTPDDLISVFIADKEVVSNAPVGEWVDGFFSVNISRVHLLEHTGSQKSSVTLFIMVELTQASLIQSITMSRTN
ncbi:hypothetical protein IB252_07095 [Pseudomonas sp. PDM10]|uniref:hypothetical protein n=1 Tax=Pseudomonas sp. PDM10 TaxID=2769269 RepID=UPI00177CAE4E|nr:hypothetical protein [Pseudomonas sp. PDM10]MBD9599582.1 hypothetical protein [Pseudomonas sp. PDM10]